MRVAAMGPEHPLVARSLHEIAELYQKIGKYEEAETLNKRALSIRMKAHGTSHPDVGTCGPMHHSSTHRCIC
jgi:hypothetical protein